MEPLKENLKCVCVCVWLFVSGFRLDLFRSLFLSFFSYIPLWTSNCLTFKAKAGISESSCCLSRDLQVGARVRSLQQRAQRF